MSGRVLMVQGTSSSAGKSLLAAALCRIFARRGLRVAPFKAQNMSNNAAVCADGSEIGRSQALQAVAAGVAPTSDMNPVLLKPEADARSQVIVNGRPWSTLGARDYFQRRKELWPVVVAALDRLRCRYELVVIEGAGSPAEMNLHHHDIVNMAVARRSQAPVLLVGDIERGGVFAQLLGTLWLLDDDDRQLIRGLVVNKFRGDISLFDEGRTYLEQRSGLPVLGVIPWLSDLHLPDEDSEALPSGRRQPADTHDLDIAVIRLPRISNFDDFDPLASEPGVRLRYVESVSQLHDQDAMILPGTKSTVSDLQWLRERGLASRLVQLAQDGGRVVGICGGYQMLGRTICDSQHVESRVDATPGLGLLPTATIFESSKETHQLEGEIIDDHHCPGVTDRAVTGYEIHLGRTFGGSPWLRLRRRNANGAELHDGAASGDGRIWGCYLHGLFANDAFRRAWLRSLRPDTFGQPPDAMPSPTGQSGFQGRLDNALNRLADSVEDAIDLPRLDAIVFNQVRS